VAEGALHRAAHFGGKLAQGYGFKGDLGRCRGWVDRTARLLDDAHIDCVEQGYLQWGLGMLRIFEAGDIASAHAHFVHAGKIGARFAHRDLVTTARIGEGRMLIYLGDIAEGMGLLDEAMVAIEAGELSPLAAGDAYCTVIDACAELLDLERCRAWTDSFVRWCDSQQELVLYRGHCFLHRAEVLELLGEWPEALVQARHACDRLAAPVNLSALGAAFAIEGDLLRLANNFDAAEAAYLRASDYGHDPQPGLALLRLARGENEAAAAMITRTLNEAEGPMARARQLGAYVEVMLATGDVGAARGVVEELRQVASTLGTPLLRAHAARARGAVLAAEGDPKAALVELRRAFTELHALGVRYDAARTRLLIGETCATLGDLDAASMESAAARAVLDSLTPRMASSLEGLTQRELEILRLLASGKTNRGIAQSLVISEKTVASHVSHIFTKLDVTSRSAATAYAYDHDLIG
jgi:DNA-binding NarL/FixJ family response regulator